MAPEVLLMLVNQWCSYMNWTCGLLRLTSGPVYILVKNLLQSEVLPSEEISKFGDSIKYQRIHVTLVSLEFFSSSLADGATNHFQHLSGNSRPLGSKQSNWHHTAMNPKARAKTNC